jgi:hypothetical protein
MEETYCLNEMKMARMWLKSLRESIERHDYSNARYGLYSEALKRGSVGSGYHKQAGKLWSQAIGPAMAGEEYTMRQV